MYIYMYIYTHKQDSEIVLVCDVQTGKRSVTNNKDIITWKRYVDDDVNITTNLLSLTFY